MQKSKVIIGLSGGVDSSVAAFLLKQQGFDVEGLFMINWHDTTGTLSGDCPWEDDRVFAELVAKKLKIPFRIVDLSESYRKRVVDYMFAEYEKGRTPNPDVLCNREIKFDIFAKVAFENGADYVATGHYVRKSASIINGVEYFHLLSGVDQNKDQSYFLCQLSQNQLKKSIFPIGHLTKPEVRRIAHEAGLVTAGRKDSQGICFVGKVDLPTFLQQKLVSKKGKIVEINANLALFKKKYADSLINEIALPFQYHENDGEHIGYHKGAHFYTIGQRKGINIGGKEKPLYVIGTNIINNILYVGQGEEHPGLFRHALRIKQKDIHWIRPDLKLSKGNEAIYLVRIRYRQPLQKAKLIQTEEDLFILFDIPQKSITSGQFAAWYDETELIGSGVIAE